MLRRIGTYISYGIILVAAAMAILFGYWLSQPEDVLVIKNSPTPVRTIREHPMANGVVILKVDYCKMSSAKGEVRPSFVSSSTEILLPKYEDKQDANCQVAEVPVLVPPQVVPGKYHIHYRILYDINPIKNNVEVEFDSKEFEITAEQVKDM